MTLKEGKSKLENNILLHTGKNGEKMNQAFKEENMKKRIRLIILDGVLIRIFAESALPNDYYKKVDLPEVKL